MRIERIELRLVRLPLVRFFETSFGRIDDRAFVLVTVEEDGGFKTRRRMRRGGEPVLQLRNDPNSLAHH